MSEETIRLRGHHLSLFADYYFNNSGRAASTPENEEEGTVDIFSDYITRRYSPQMRKRMDNLWKRLIDEPQSEVLIVEGLDSLCDGCPHYDPRKYDPKQCNPMENDLEDKATVDEYELETSNQLSQFPYRTRELLRRFEAYRRSTRFKSPRDRFLELMKLYPPEPQNDDISDDEIESLMSGGKKMSVDEIVDCNGNPVTNSGIDQILDKFFIFFNLL